MYESDLPFSHSLSIVVLLTHSHSLIFRYSGIAQLLRILGLVFEELTFTFVLFEVGALYSAASIGLCCINFICILCRCSM